MFNLHELCVQLLKSITLYKLTYNWDIHVTCFLLIYKINHAHHGAKYRMHHYKKPTHTFITISHDVMLRKQLPSFNLLV